MLLCHLLALGKVSCLLDLWCPHQVSGSSGSSSSLGCHDVMYSLCVQEKHLVVPRGDLGMCNY